MIYLLSHACLNWIFLILNINYICFCIDLEKFSTINECNAHTIANFKFGERVDMEIPLPFNVNIFEYSPEISRCYNAGDTFCFKLNNQEKKIKFSGIYQGGISYISLNNKQLQIIPLKICILQINDNIPEVPNCNGNKTLQYMIGQYIYKEYYVPFSIKEYQSPTGLKECYTWHSTFCYEYTLGKKVHFKGYYPAKINSIIVSSGSNHNTLKYAFCFVYIKPNLVFSVTEGTFIDNKYYEGLKFERATTFPELLKTTKEPCTKYLLCYSLANGGVHIYGIMSSSSVYISLFKHYGDNIPYVVLQYKVEKNKIFDKPNDPTVVWEGNRTLNYYIGEHVSIEFSFKHNITKIEKSKYLTQCDSFETQLCFNVFKNNVINVKGMYPPKHLYISIFLNQIEDYQPYKISFNPVKENEIKKFIFGQSINDDLYTNVTIENVFSFPQIMNSNSCPENDLCYKHKKDNKGINVYGKMINMPVYVSIFLKKHDRTPKYVVKYDFINEKSNVDPRK